MYTYLNAFAELLFFLTKNEKRAKNIIEALLWVIFFFPTKNCDKILVLISNFITNHISTHFHSNLYTVMIVPNTSGWTLSNGFGKPLHIFKEQQYIKRKKKIHVAYIFNFQHPLTLQVECLKSSFDFLV